MLPPSVQSTLQSTHTTTFVSDLPQTIQNDKNEPVIIGVDEAGRGPCLGALVYGISYCLKSFEQDLKRNYVFDDSKKLTDAVRKSLFSQIWDVSEHSENTPEASQLSLELSQNVGYATTAIQATDISSGMLKFPPTENYNLNEQSHDATINLIHTLVNKGLNIDHIYIDTVGPPHTYQKKLETIFPRIKFTVAKKADSLFVIVSVASVVAKVTRDLVLEQMISRVYHPQSMAGAEETDTGANHEFVPVNCGSGYPSDPNTVRWLKDNQTPLFGWPKEITRFSWSTCQTLFKNPENSIIIDWEEDFIVNGANNNKKAAQLFMLNNKQEKMVTLDNWYS
ncbi:hypothetical protein ACO0QE_001147 [Hanseniaspora vineae]